MVTERRTQAPESPTTRTLTWPQRTPPFNSLFSLSRSLQNMILSSPTTKTQNTPSLPHTRIHALVRFQNPCHVRITPRSDRARTSHASREKMENEKLESGKTESTTDLRSLGCGEREREEDSDEDLIGLVCVCVCSVLKWFWDDGGRKLKG